jgi:hypothetical protein
MAMTLVIGTVADACAQESTPSPDQPSDVLAFEIYPKGKALGDFFAPEIDAGDTADLTVVLANTGTIAFQGRTYAANAHTAVNGGFAIAEAGAPPSGVTTWLDYPERVDTIEPGKGIERSFSVAVPEQTDPGQYITALILENAEAVAVEGSENFRQIVRFAVPVFITVPGPIEAAFEIGDIGLTSNDASAEISIGIVNTGNVRVRPSGTVKVLAPDGAQLYSAPVSMGSVYARDSTSLIVPIAQPLASGNYRITVDLKDEDTKATAKGEATVTSTAAATPAASAPLQILNATGTPRPDAQDIQFLDVSATISNAGEPLTNVRVVLRASRNAEIVEDFALASSLAVPSGETLIQQRYIPVTGWTAGTWQFTLAVEAVDPSSGVAQVLATADLAELTIS